MSNYGKHFEEDIKNSIPKTVFVQRLKDDTSRFKNVCNIADYILYRYPTLYLLELKSHKGKSIPFGALREKQIEGLYAESKKRGVKAGFLFNFRELSETYFIDADDVTNFILEGERKSFPVEWCREKGHKIESYRVRTRERYKIDRFLDEI